MAEFITDLVTPNQLTAAVQEAFTGSLPFEPLIPSVGTDNLRQEISSVDLTASAEVAKYRSWETVPDIGRRPGFTLEEYEIAPLGHSYRLNEEDLAKIDRIRQGAAERLDQSVIDTIYDDGLRATEAVENRITLTHAELLQFGRVTLDELGNPEVANAVRVTFPVPANQMGVVPAGAAWSNPATARPDTDLKAWEAIFRANNRGRNPDAWGVSADVVADLAANQVLIQQLYPNAVALPGMIANEQVGQALRMLGVRAPLRLIDEVERPKLDGSGYGPVIDPRKVIGLVAGMARTYFTPPPVLATMPGNARIDRRTAQGVIAYAMMGIRPPEVITTAEAVALPLLERPSQLFVATV